MIQIAMEEVSCSLVVFKILAQLMEFLNIAAEEFQNSCESFCKKEHKKEGEVFCSLRFGAVKAKDSIKLVPLCAC